MSNSSGNQPAGGYNLNPSFVNTRSSQSLSPDEPHAPLDFGGNANALGLIPNTVINHSHQDMFPYGRNSASPFDSSSEFGTPTTPAIPRHLSYTPTPTSRNVQRPRPYVNSHSRRLSTPFSDFEGLGLQQLDFGSSGSRQGYPSTQHELNELRRENADLRHENVVLTTQLETLQNVVKSFVQARMDVPTHPLANAPAPSSVSLHAVPSVAVGVDHHDAAFRGRVWWHKPDQDVLDAARASATHGTTGLVFARDEFGITMDGMSARDVNRFIRETLSKLDPRDVHKSIGSVAAEVMSTVYDKVEAYAPVLKLCAHRWKVRMAVEEQWGFWHKHHFLKRIKTEDRETAVETPPPTRTTPDPLDDSPGITGDIRVTSGVPATSTTPAKRPLPKPKGRKRPSNVADDETLLQRGPKRNVPASGLSSVYPASTPTEPSPGPRISPLGDVTPRAPSDTLGSASAPAMTGIAPQNLAEPNNGDFFVTGTPAHGPSRSLTPLSPVTSNDAVPATRPAQPLTSDPATSTRAPAPAPLLLPSTLSNNPPASSATRADLPRTVERNVTPDIAARRSQDSGKVAPSIGSLQLPAPFGPASDSLDEDLDLSNDGIGQVFSAPRASEDVTAASSAPARPKYHRKSVLAQSFGPAPPPTGISRDAAIEAAQDAQSAATTRSRKSRAPAKAKGAATAYSLWQADFAWEGTAQARLAYWNKQVPEDVKKMYKEKAAAMAMEGELAETAP